MKLHIIDTAEIRKKCQNSINNTNVGKHLGSALDEVDRLAQLLTECHSGTVALARLASDESIPLFKPFEVRAAKKLRDRILSIDPTGSESALVHCETK